MPEPAGKEPDALVITGATATGKTALSIEVAKALRAEVISMDSRQIYRGMDIGTAKPGPAEQQAVPHHGIDIVDPDERYSAGRFATEARAWIHAAACRGRVPLLVGGTGFFLRALTNPLFNEPQLDRRRRDLLEQWLAERSTAELVRWLSTLDPELGSRLAQQGGRQRLIRALEVTLLTGLPLAWWQEHQPGRQHPLRPLVFVLELPREELYRRISQRVIDMIDAGLVDEVRSLVRRGYDEQTPAMNATGYIELLPYLRGEYDLAAAIDAIQRATRRYARRQHTWFRHQLPADAVRLDALKPRSELVDLIVHQWQPEVSSAHRD